MNNLLNFYSKANPKGYFNFLERTERGSSVIDGGYALQNVNIGLGNALSIVNPDSVNMVFQKLKIEEIIGERVRLMEFTQDELETPLIKYAGEPSQYNDFVNPNSLNMNVSVIRTAQLRDSINIRVGDLESGQLSKMGINETEKALGGALNILLYQWNKIAFFGVESEAKVYGLLNYPELSEYISLDSDLSNLTYNTLLSDIQKLIQELETQNNHITDDSVMKLALSPALSAALKLDGNMQKSLRQYLLENYPNMEIITAVNELKGAYNGKSVVYIIAETPIDGSMEKRTAINPYSELALFGRVVEKENHVSQNLSIGHSGTVVLKPQNVVRGVVANGNG